MISVKFKDFYRRNYQDRGYHLYVVIRNNTDILYIGISQWSIYERWFGSGFSHMFLDDQGRLHGLSSIGEMIVDNLPGSLNWAIELWTMKDCYKFLKKDLQNTNYKNLDLRVLEEQMIRKLQPVYNSMLNYDNPKAKIYHHFTEEELDKAYDEIFNKGRKKNSSGY